MDHRNRPFIGILARVMLVMVFAVPGIFAVIFSKFKDPKPQAANAEPETVRV